MCTDVRLIVHSTAMCTAEAQGAVHNCAIVPRFSPPTVLLPLPTLCKGDPGLKANSCGNMKEGSMIVPMGAIVQVPRMITARKIRATMKTQIIYAFIIAVLAMTRIF